MGQDNKDGQDTQTAEETQPVNGPGTIISAVEDLQPRIPTGLEPTDTEYQQRIRQLEADLHWSQEHLRMVVDGAQDYAIFMLDPDGIILTWNTGAQRIKQWTTEEIIGQHFRVLYRPEDRKEHRAERNLNKTLSEGMFEETYPRMKKDGTIFIADVVIRPILDEASGELRGFSKVVRDVTERQILLQRLVTAQENERRRIARELHDESGQHLAALAMGLRSMESKIETNTQAQALLLRLSGITDDLAKVVHRVAIELRPSSLDDMGLVRALRGYIERWSGDSGIHVDFETFGLNNFNNGANRFSELVETTVYRVVQEALTNAAKHATKGPDRVARIGITMQRFDHRLQITIEDDGPGFDVEAAQQSGRLGLAGMQERAAACGGTLEIESAQGEGTTIFLCIPAEFL